MHGSSPNSVAVTLAQHHADRPFRRHRHQELVIVCLLRGGVQEGLPSGEVEGGPLMVGIKAPDTWHTDHFGPGGAAAVRIAVPGALFDALPASPVWQQSGWRCAGHALPSFTRLALAVARGAATDDLAWDALAAVAHDSRPGGVPPAWLERVRAQLESHLDEHPSLTAYATLAGVHPVYLARTFRRWYGCSIVSWRRRHRIGMAADRMYRQQETLSQIAAALHWCDHAAMCRAFARETGVSPGRYRSLLRR